jgi:soluble lytic murein transglycosylase-like protein
MASNFDTYSPLAKQAAQQYGVPTDLFQWQIGQESSWNPNAVNGNAVGIAQFMPATAAQFSIDPKDPAASLSAAAQYDSQLYAKFGDWNKVLAAYGTTTNNGVKPPSGVLGTIAGVAASTVGAVASAGDAAKTAGKAINPVNWLGLSLSRSVSVILGLVFVAGAIYTIKPVQEIVNGAAGAATNALKVAATAAA